MLQSRIAYLQAAFAALVLPRDARPLETQSVRALGPAIQIIWDGIIRLQSPNLNTIEPVFRASREFQREAARQSAGSNTDSIRLFPLAKRAPRLVIPAFWRILEFFGSMDLCAAGRRSTIAPLLVLDL